MFLPGLGRSRRYSASSGGDYFFAFKVNRPAMLEAVAAFFADPPAQSSPSPENENAPDGPTTSLDPSSVKCDSPDAEAQAPATRFRRDGPSLRTARVVDATAAGDSSNGAFIAALADGADTAQAIAAGHRLARIVVGFPGAIIPQASARPQ